MSFETALSGLNAASGHLSVISHNIANANTVGFKGSRAEFERLQPAGSNLGSTAIGSGVKFSNVAQDFSQGGLSITNGALDLAVSGEGFFTMGGSEGITYTRAGAFTLDKDGFAVNEGGQRLQVSPPLATGGFASGTLTDIQVLTTASPPNATTEIDVGVNLPSEATVPVLAFDPTAVTSAMYNQSASYTVFDSFGQTHNVTNYFVQSSDPVTGVAIDNQWDQWTFVDGQDISLDSDAATDATAVARALAFDVAAGNAVGTTTIPFPSPTIIQFNNSGILVTPAAAAPLTTGQIEYTTIAVGGGAADLTFTLDFSVSTQFGGDYAINSIGQDGYATGRLTGIAVDNLGVISARFSNGQLDPLGKIVLTQFPNSGGLTQVANTSWAENFAAGVPRTGEAGTSDFGLIESGALESSNIDLTEELVNMIVAQRSFEANAQVISKLDEVQERIINLR
ncbi:MAG: flagellar hook protein FlgE [Pseudomonadales bacterium]|nr:flagellar hook protein FlgE [Pseudomonadales bacterium]